jgi:phosphoglycerate-specific signal transduction histidine kinase
MFYWPQNMSNESEERNIVEQQQSQGAIEFTQAKEMLVIGQTITSYP